jgi:hypothetical protein
VLQEEDLSLGKTPALGGNVKSKKNYEVLEAVPDELSSPSLTA